MKLTKDKLERLAILSEKCAEVIHLTMKTIRHGEMESHPDTPSVPNIEMLSEEIGDLMFQIAWCIESGDIDNDIVTNSFDERENTINKYLHFNNFKIE
jgi:NTP pyrophosphatase (non-canonical NTP hydrolase)